MHLLESYARCQRYAVSRFIEDGLVRTLINSRFVARSGEALFRDQLVLVWSVRQASWKSQVMACLLESTEEESLCVSDELSPPDKFPPEVSVVAVCVQLRAGLYSIEWFVMALVSKITLC